MSVLENPGQMESPRRITEEADLPSLLFGDQIRLKQVLINLVNNALKFTKNGQICVKAAYDTLAELLIVHVTDTGKGISENSKTNLFKAFGKIKISVTPTRRVWAWDSSSVRKLWKIVVARLMCIPMAKIRALRLCSL